MICTDLTYYVFYIMLCSDDAYKLMFYFYYIKYVKKNDIIYFYHINFNVPDLIKNQKAHQIQELIFFIFEDEINCTEMLLGMYKHFQAWWNCVSCCELNTDDFVY